MNAARVTRIDHVTEDELTADTTALYDACRVLERWGYDVTARHVEHIEKSIRQQHAAATGKKG